MPTSFSTEELRRWATATARTLPAYKDRKAPRGEKAIEERWECVLRAVVGKEIPRPASAYLYSSRTVAAQVVRFSVAQPDNQPEITTMPQLRTFFLVKVVHPCSTATSTSIAERFTCPDIRQQLVVEQVDARLTGTPLTIDNLVSAYPEAVRATHYWGAMKTQAHADNSLRGPFIIVTNGEGEPTDADLLNWYAKSIGAPITQETKDSEALAATGFLRPIVDKLAEMALITPAVKKKAKAR